MGLQQSFGGLRRLLGPIWAGAVYQHMGARQTFWAAAVLVAASALTALRLRPASRRERGPQTRKARSGDLA
jgi:predicted MFS family arabinose efflux permease